MPEFHAEPYVYLPAVTHQSALIAWGAFYFRVKSSGAWKLVDDDDLRYVHPPRRESIGARSAPYGPAHVEVFDQAGVHVATAQTTASNHCWVTGLEPDREYRYKVFVKGEEWASGVRWDWSQADRALVQAGGRYEHRFRTNPSPAAPAPTLTFAVIGDFGVGVKTSSPTRQQQRIADALRHAVATEGVRFILTTGDNIYASKRLLGIPLGATGDEDDDWFFTYFQPYRYFINQIPIYPSIGNHDADESEDFDDRAQVEDNFYVSEWLSGEEAVGRASCGPGLFYRLRYGADIELICIDTSTEAFLGRRRLFELPKHWTFLEQTFPPAADGVWRIPFAHHPPYSAGPRHHNTRAMVRLVPLLQRAGVRVMFSGHEHNFQHSIADGIHYFVSGAAGRFRGGIPDRFAQAFTRSWSPQCHFLLVRIEGRRMVVRAIGGRIEGGELLDITRMDPSGQRVTSSMEICC